MTTAPPFLKRAVLKNYKSIAACAVDFQPLTFLVGPNGSGKSNFLDSLRFTCESLRTSLDRALRDRGGINEVRRRSSGHPTHFGIRLEFHLPDLSGHYAFRIAARPKGSYEVQAEECVVHGARGGRFLVEAGEVKHKSLGGSSGIVFPAAAKDRLYLVNASGIAAFRPVYDALSRMGFYNLNPDRIRDLQTPDSGELLARDGSNLSSVLRQLAENAPARKERIEDYLARVAPGISGVDVKVVGPKETVEFRQEVAGANEPWRFLAANMSDGTVRVLGILVALLQSRNASQPDVHLIGIEEPEVALHPGASDLLLDALREASASTQVVVTTHSPDLIDNIDLGSEALLAVLSDKGATRIAPVDPASIEAVKNGLYTPGELLRLSQLEPDAALFGERARLPLFDEAEY
jgi:predicted ATPase